MKRRTTHIALTLAFMLAFATAANAQLLNHLQYFRAPGKAGLNVFEPPKVTTVDFNGMFLKVGGDFAIQFQGLSQSNDANTLMELNDNMTLPTANMNVDVQIDEGMRMHLRTYLSSRNHSESWVKGGYLQVDNLNFISDGFLAGFMDVARFRFGMDEINYGDTHFRRSDNAGAIYNPFVGNYIMDSFTTEPFGEVTVMKSGFLGVLGLTNGRLNQSPMPGDDGIAAYAKVGYDSQLNEDLRVRLTGSYYTSSDKSTRDYLYAGDRAGARYYNILETEESASNFRPRFNPGFAYHSAFQINPFVKFQGLEAFGVFEVSSNGEDTGGSYTQLGAEVLYRFGASEKVYVGGRYNTVKGEAGDEADMQEISRVNIGGGWFLTDNVLAKLEYVTSSYDGAGFTGMYEGAAFSGFVFEAVISF